jgi:GLPGLI family protein
MKFRQIMVYIYPITQISIVIYSIKNLSMIYKKTIITLGLIYCYCFSYSQPQKFIGKIEYSNEIMLASGTYKEYNKITSCFNAYSYCIILTAKPPDIDAQVENVMKTLLKYTSKYNTVPLDSLQIQHEKAKIKARIEENSNGRDYSIKTFIDYSTYISVMQCKIGNEGYCVTDTLKKTEWVLLEDTMTIEGLLCQKARGLVMGKYYDVWFAPSVPFSAGPAGMYGLPGIIVLATSENKKRRYQLTKLEYPVSSPVEFTGCTNEKTITNTDYNLLLDKYRKDRQQKMEESKKTNQF